MKMPPVLLVCFLMTCSVWTVYGRCIEVDDSDQEDMNDEISLEASKLPGLCWACKWALNKVKKELSDNSTVEQVSSKLKGVCNQIGLLKSKCRSFVQKRLEELVEELTTTDDVRTICVNMKACKPKEFFDQFHI
ncbi:antimicrobial peptide NK-lysin-like [Genypterus blacodes]|uniref:antimicrobial peptide NK-lysin-like n=1 Tax=Genypterus blacodes TaxID=154954 RepID=UPI003F75CFA8